MMRYPEGPAIADEDLRLADISLMVRRLGVRRGMHHSSHHH